MCSSITSDNQTSFKRAKKIINFSFEKAIRDIVRGEEVQRFSAERGIKWQFITERSPFRGGYWERLNRSLKEPLRKVLGKALLSYSELNTILTDIECALNQRPLAYSGSDPMNPEPLTPAHLALGRPLASLPDPPKASTIPIGTRYRHLQRLLHHFWQRWTKEYLPLLTERKKWTTVQPVPDIGDVVLITEDNVTRPNWPLGRVIEQFRGKDGLVRTLRLKTAKGTLDRPVQRLHLLEKADLPEKEAASDPDPEEGQDSQVPEPEDEDAQVLDAPAEVQGGQDVPTWTQTRYGRSVRPVDRLRY